METGHEEEGIAVTSKHIVSAVGACSLGALALGVAGCGTTPADEAASTPSTRGAVTAFVADTKACPDRSGSWTYKPVVVNLTDAFIVLRAGDYTCNDWSGTSTPGRVFNREVLPPNLPTRFTLEPRDNVSRNWTMEFTPRNEAGSLGTARMSVGAGSSTLRVAGSSEVSISKDTTCDIRGISPTSLADTPMPALAAIRGKASLAIAVYKGKFSLVSFCRINAEPAVQK